MFIEKQHHKTYQNEILLGSGTSCSLFTPHWYFSNLRKPKIMHFPMPQSGCWGCFCFAIFLPLHVSCSLALKLPPARLLGIPFPKLLARNKPRNLAFNFPESSWMMLDVVFPLSAYSLLAHSSAIYQIEEETLAWKIRSVFNIVYPIASHYRTLRHTTSYKYEGTSFSIIYISSNNMTLTLTLTLPNIA